MSQIPEEISPDNPPAKSLSKTASYSAEDLSKIDASHTTPLSGAPPAVNKPAWERLRWRVRTMRSSGGGSSSVPNAQAEYEKTLSPLDRLAVRITEKIGSFGFFLIIFFWTVAWCGYNILASQITSLHWKAFDPFPAFVAYLLISNVIQILLMPLIMIGQNLQARFADTRSQLDFEVNRLAEREATANLRHMEHQTTLLLLLLKNSNVQVPEEELVAIEASLRNVEALACIDPVAGTSGDGENEMYPIN